MLAAATGLVALSPPATSLSNALSAAQRLAIPSSLNHVSNEPRALLDVVFDVIPLILKTRASAPDVPASVHHGVAKARIVSEVMQSTTRIVTKHPFSSKDAKSTSINLSDAESITFQIDSRSRLPSGHSLTIVSKSGSTMASLDLDSELTVS